MCADASMAAALEMALLAALDHPAEGGVCTPESALCLARLARRRQVYQAITNRVDHVVMQTRENWFGKPGA